VNLAALTQTQAAALLSISPRTLRDWHDAPRNGDGTYPGPALVAFYVGKLGGGSEFDNQRERLAAAQAEKVEHENAIRRGQVAPIAAVEKFWIECISNARARILGMGPKLGPQLRNIGDPSVIAAAINAEARAALNDLADYRPDAADFGSDSASVANVEAAAGPDGGAVGGSGTPPVQRKQRRTGAVANG
jgi:hypothetical protein